MLVTKRDGSRVRCGSAYYLSAHRGDPRREGGPDAPENLETPCFACHGRDEAKRRAGNT